MSDETKDEAVDEAAAAEPEAAEPEVAKEPKAAKRKKAGADAKAPASWGFPQFAKDFPKHPELDALVAAFSRGDYAAVRDGAPKLAASTDDEAVKLAATTLRQRIEPDPTSKMLFLFAGALLAFLTLWWVLHDGPEGAASTPTKVTPKVEHVD